MGKATAVLTTGTTTTLKLFVGALAFTSAYIGFSAYGTATSAPAQAHTVTLAAQSMPVTTPIAARPGAITVATGASTAGCAKTLQARSILINTKPSQTMLYGWSLTRWNAGTQQWRPYLSDYAGFSGEQRTVKWAPRIVANPGWYRIELSVQAERRSSGRESDEGANEERSGRDHKHGKTIKSDRFQVSC